MHNTMSAYLSLGDSWSSAEGDVRTCLVVSKEEGGKDFGSSGHPESDRCAVLPSAVP